MRRLLFTMNDGAAWNAEKKEREMESTIERITGQCHCGNIQYEAQGAIIKSSTCDCPGCRRATGTFRAPFVTIFRKDFRLKQGEPSEFRAESGERCDAHGTWHFCPECGTHIFWKGNEGDELDLFAGTLDDASLVETLFSSQR